MKRTIPLLFLGLALVGCAKKNEPSADLFQKIIMADSTVSTQKICKETYTFLSGILPAEYDEIDAKYKGDYKNLAALQELGYVDIQKIQIQRPMHSPLPGFRATFTPKGKATFGSGQEGCYGVWKANKVKSFTPPSDVNGEKISQVTVTGTQEYAGWATEPKLRELFGIKDLPAEGEKTIVLTLKNTGWEVAKAN